MENFIFLNDTKIIFGKDAEANVGAEIAKFGKKILFHHYGDGIIEKIGLYDKVINSLKENNIEYVELTGVTPNPRLSLVKDGIEICRKEKIDFVLAVGGGSVIDSAKAIAVGYYYDGDVWDYFTGEAQINGCLPVGVILTIPATGSEASKTTVITNDDGLIKRALDGDEMRPKFSILNPEVTYSLPKYQTAAGGFDIMSHVFERYFTNVVDVDLTDRLCEGLLKAMINYLPRALENPYDYEARSQIMWAGTIAHNGLLGTGRIEDWASHMIGHEISALYNMTHGATLTIIFPAWMKYVYKENVNRFAQFACRVWNVEQDFENPEKVAMEGIRKMTEFFRQIGLPVSLAEGKIPEDKIEEMAEKCTSRGPLGNVKKLYKKDVVEIFNLAK